MSKTINGMNASELKQLLRDTIEKINQIDGSISQIDANLLKSSESNDKVDSLLYDITDAYNEIYGFEGNENHDPKESKLDKLKEAYNTIIIGNDENIALKTQIEEFVTYIETKKLEVDKFKKQIFGDLKTKDDGTEERIPGLFDNINNFHTSQKEKFQTLYDKIEEELTAGTTSVALAKVFSDKVVDYNKENNKWSNIFIFIILFILGYYALSTINNDTINNLSELGNFLLLRAPFFAMAIWLLIFIGNRRAEAKKLEEGYKHKEVMARSFIGYKKSIEDLEGEIKDEDKELMKLHMKNLLDTINQDTSSFLNSKGENHPFFDIFGNIFKKENFPNGTIETEFGKIEFNKK
ncbi:MAG: hypothetical protein PHR68_03105 [Candidatus Gracilibacteria bacterium]|nr:hypothetical protein [Candidatus Gracilibacteria bacterium]